MEKENIGMKYFLNYWISRINSLNIVEHQKRYEIYIEAFNYIPNSYKIRYMFLKEKIDFLNKKCILNKEYEKLEGHFEDSLKYFNKMPRIWLMYSEVLQKQGKIKKLLLLLDRSLKSVAVPQHKKIWDFYLVWIRNLELKKLAETIFERYLKYNDQYYEDYIEYLLDNKNYEKGFLYLVKLINNADYYPVKYNKYEYAMKLCKLISETSIEITEINNDDIFKYCLKKYSDEIGNIWVYYAHYYLGKAEFEKTREIFKKALVSVNTKKDFGIVFNAFLNFEEGLALILVDNPTAEYVEKENNLLREIDSYLDVPQDSNNRLETPDEEEIQFKRINDLLEKRSFYLNECILRQNFNNIEYWLKKFHCMERNEKVYLDIFSEALQKIDFDKVQGISDLFIFLAEFFLEKKDIRKMNYIIEKAFSFNFTILKEYETLVLFWLETLLELNYENDVIFLLEYLLSIRKEKNMKEFINLKILNYLKNSLKLWSFYIDLLLNLQDDEKVIKIYDSLITKKLCSGFNIINYLNYLFEEENMKKFFRVCEMAVNSFDWKISRHLWLIYITKYEEAHTDINIEKIRELYERVLEQAPENDRWIFYLLFGNFEENHGLLNHQIEIFDQMVRNSDKKTRLMSFKIYLVKVNKYFGISRTRQIYEKCLLELEVDDKINMGLEYALMELKLKEIDRVRQIYIYLAQFCEPEIEEYGFWNTWENFEIEWGNEDSYRDFIRNKTAIKKKYDILPPTLKRIKRKIELEGKEDLHFNL